MTSDRLLMNNYGSPPIKFVSGQGTVLFDDNGISIDGPISLSNSENTIDRFKAYNWNTIPINGHDPKAIKSAIIKAQKSKKPTLIACKTRIGFGSPNKEGKSSAHELMIYLLYWVIQTQF